MMPYLKDHFELLQLQEAGVKAGAANRDGHKVRVF